MAKPMQDFIQEHSRASAQMHESIVILCRGALHNTLTNGSALPDLNSHYYLDGCIAAAEARQRLRNERRLVGAVSK
jgi:hypothetical protein